MQLIKAQNFEARKTDCLPLFLHNRFQFFGLQLRNSDYKKNNHYKLFSLKKNQIKHLKNRDFVNGNTTNFFITFNHSNFIKNLYIDLFTLRFEPPSLYFQNDTWSHIFEFLDIKLRESDEFIMYRGNDKSNINMC